MSTQEKAREIVERFTDELFESGKTISKPLIQVVSIICVDEIIKSGRTLFYHQEEAKSSFIEYWINVKKEIELL